MNLKEKRQYESQVRVGGVIAGIRERLKAMPLGIQLLAKFDDRRAASDRLFTAQSAGRDAARIASATRGGLRGRLRRTAQDVLRLLRTMGATADADLRIPRRSDRDLATDAKAIRDRATPLAASFTANSLSLPEDLGAQIAAFEAVMDDQRAARETHVAARTAAAQALKDCAAAIDGLEPLYFTIVGDDPNAIATWKAARRIGPARPDHTAQEATPAPASETATPAKTA